MTAVGSRLAVEVDEVAAPPEPTDVVVTAGMMMGGAELTAVGSRLAGGVAAPPEPTDVVVTAGMMMGGTELTAVGSRLAGGVAAPPESGEVMTAGMLSGSLTVDTNR